MVTTIGEAFDGGWTLTVRCGWGKRDGMKSIRECVASAEMDLETLVWARGYDFPINALTVNRMRCPVAGPGAGADASGDQVGETWGTFPPFPGYIGVDRL